jgi:limonene-1,2-epoxide hydrolase
MSDDDFNLIRRFNAAGHQEDDSALDELVTPDFVAHNGDLGDVHGADGWRAFLADGAAQLGPTEAGIDELTRGGEFVGERWWVRTTTPGSKPFSRIHGITMHHIVDGRIAEQWATMQIDE